MKKQVTITYSWHNAQGTEIKASHQETLEEDAMTRINAEMQEGMTSGELHSTVCIDESDGADGIEYSGHWEIDSKTL